MANAPIGGGTPASPGSVYDYHHPGAYSTTNFGLPATPGWTTPDYNSIIDRLLGPLRSQIDLQSNLARANAQLAQSGLSEQHKLALKSMIATLQAHGLGTSGEPHYRKNLEDNQYQRATNLAANQLLAYLTSLQNQLQEGLRSTTDYVHQTYTPTPNYGDPNKQWGLPT